MYYIYAIYNPAHDKIYIGQTKNLKERMRLHNKHILKGYTSRFDGKWILVYQEECVTRSAALTREKQLKSFKGREFIKKIIPR